MKEMNKKIELSRIEAISALIFALSVGVVLGLADLIVLDYSFGQIAGYTALLSLFAGYISGEVRDLKNLETYETLFAATTVVVLGAVMFSSQIEQMLTQNLFVSAFVFCIVCLGYVIMAIRN